MNQTTSGPCGQLSGAEDASWHPSWYGSSLDQQLLDAAQEKRSCRWQSLKLLAKRTLTDHLQVTFCYAGIGRCNAALVSSPRAYRVLVAARQGTSRDDG
jgi:hypothetical protein